MDDETVILVTIDRAKAVQLLEQGFFHQFSNKLISIEFTQVDNWITLKLEKKFLDYDLVHIRSSNHDRLENGTLGFALVEEISDFYKTSDRNDGLKIGEESAFICLDNVLYHVNYTFQMTQQESVLIVFLNQPIIFISKTINSNQKIAVNLCHLYNSNNNNMYFGHTRTFGEAHKSIAHIYDSWTIMSDDGLINLDYSHYLKEYISYKCNRNIDGMDIINKEYSYNDDFLIDSKPLPDRVTVSMELNQDYLIYLKDILDRIIKKGRVDKYNNIELSSITFQSNGTPDIQLDTENEFCDIWSLMSFLLSLISVKPSSLEIENKNEISEALSLFSESVIFLLIIKGIHQFTDMIHRSLYRFLIIYTVSISMDQMFYIAKYLIIHRNAIRLEGWSRIKLIKSIVWLYPAIIRHRGLFYFSKKYMEPENQSLHQDISTTLLFIAASIGDDQVFEECYQSTDNSPYPTLIDVICENLDVDMAKTLFSHQINFFDVNPNANPLWTLAHVKDCKEKFIFLTKALNDPEIRKIFYFVNNQRELDIEDVAMLESNFEYLEFLHENSINYPVKPFVCYCTSKQHQPLQHSSSTTTATTTTKTINSNIIPTKDLWESDRSATTISILINRDKRKSIQFMLENLKIFKGTFHPCDVYLINMLNRPNSLELFQMLFPVKFINSQWPYYLNHTKIPFISFAIFMDYGLIHYVGYVKSLHLSTTFKFSQWLEFARRYFSSQFNLDYLTGLSNINNCNILDIFMIFGTGHNVLSLLEELGDTLITKQTLDLIKYRQTDQHEINSMIKKLNEKSLEFEKKANEILKELTTSNKKNKKQSKQQKQQQKQKNKPTTSTTTPTPIDKEKKDQINENQDKEITDKLETNLKLNNNHNNTNNSNENINNNNNNNNNNNQNLSSSPKQISIVNKTTTITKNKHPSTTTPPLTIKINSPSPPSSQQQSNLSSSPNNKSKINNNNNINNNVLQTLINQKYENHIGKFKFNNEDIIGRGSNGTLVLRGLWSDRIPVAIKKIIKGFDSLIDKEIEVLIQLTTQSSQSSKLVRYIDREEDKNFLYLGLTLCDLSLQQLIEDPNHNQQFNSLDKRILIDDIIEGVRFLHSNQIVHNDLNPRNILFKDGHLLISDMGLSKMMVETSFAFTHAPSGQGGYYPSEVIRHQRKTNKVDIFSIGCLIYYILTGGKHPFGDDIYLRLPNILTNQFSLIGLSNDDYSIDLITQMINIDESKRPTIESVVRHPFFWNMNQNLKFIDSIYQVIRKYTPTSLNIIDNRPFLHDSWDKSIDSNLLIVLNEGSQYNFNNVKDLIRCIRNTIQHHQEIYSDKNKKILYFKTQQQSFEYFTQRYPTLILYLYQFFRNTNDHNSDYLKEFYQ